MGQPLAEAHDLARLTSEAYNRLMAYYRKEHKLSPVDADALAMDRPVQILEGIPSHEIHWITLNALLASDPQAATAVWKRICADAAGHVEDGYAVAESLNYQTPWERAQFLVIRAALYEEWKPTAIERLLLDQIAHAHMSYLIWAGRVQERYYPNDKTTPVYQAAADAIDQAMQMADKFNRLAVRTLRALRDLRRSGVVIVAGAGAQVNVGQQQVNITKADTTDTCKELSP